MENNKQIFSFPKFTSNSYSKSKSKSKSTDFKSNNQTQKTHQTNQTQQTHQTQQTQQTHQTQQTQINSPLIFSKNKNIKFNHSQKNSIGILKNIKINTNYLNSEINLNKNPIESKIKKIFTPEIISQKKYIVSHSIFFKEFPRFFPAKTSEKSFGFIGSYAANSNPGQIKKYNEDRISIIQNVIKPPSRKNEEWPKVSFFAIYDGHEGIKCSDFLKENLHHYVCKNLKHF